MTGRPARRSRSRSGNRRSCTPMPRWARRPATTEAADLLAAMVQAEIPRWPSSGRRRGAETVAIAARGALDDELAGTVAAYRSGYLPDDRRDLEAGLRDGAAHRHGDHERPRARHQHHRPRRGADRGLAGDLGVAVAAGRPGRARRAPRDRRVHRPRRPARHLPGPPPGHPAPSSGRARRARPGQPVRARPAPRRRRGRTSAHRA